MKLFKFTSETIVPALFFQNIRDNISAKALLKLAAVKNKVIIRITGGCGKMSLADSESMLDLFRSAFQGYQGAMIFGGTRMIVGDDKENIYPTITEIAPMLKYDSPEIVILGIIPKTAEMAINNLGLTILHQNQDGLTTIIHPYQDECMVIQKNVDSYASWEDEWQISAKIVDQLTEFANFKKMLICYNGGSFTEQELQYWAEQNWPVALIANSGRITSQYAQDLNFLSKNSSIKVVNDYVQLRQMLVAIGGVKVENNFKIVNLK